jgi:hypothetical protein
MFLTATLLPSSNKISKTIFFITCKRHIRVGVMLICVLDVVFFLVVVVFVFTLVLAVVVNRICFVFIVERCSLLLCFVYCVLFECVVTLCMCYLTVVSYCCTTATGLKLHCS